ncbi:hypothetical protein PVK06_034805 [Gossypium arboreum]|uniref:Uncharacterized protein n=1 Tax=Gossypium arboreum TaxID=29729 RepID=A0ABR0NI87_GOSAR|nr:hypothetical protein PVK06_034805 [Gossypium arboreum]
MKLKAKLHAPPKGSPCNIATCLHWGNKGARLKVKSEDKYEVLKAKPFAYASKTPYKEAEKPKPKHPAAYYYTSPPLPSHPYKPPPYYYISPLLSSPIPTYVYKSSSPPTHSYN